MDTKLEIRDLNIAHLARVMDLQDSIIHNFHTDEKHFILKRSAADFMRALENKECHMIGIFEGERLIAQSMFEFPDSERTRDMPEFAGDVAAKDLVIYKATLVDMAYRGHGIMGQLLAYREQKARAHGKTTAISQIAIDNPSSWINALKNGMSIRKVDKDPFDQAEVFYLRKDLNAPQLPVNEDQAFVMPIGKDVHKIPALFNKMNYIAKQGYRGVRFDKATGAIIWVKPDDRAHNRSEVFNLKDSARV